MRQIKRYKLCQNRAVHLTDGRPGRREREEPFDPVCIPTITGYRGAERNVKGCSQFVPFQFKKLSGGLHCIIHWIWLLPPKLSWIWGIIYLYINEQPSLLRPFYVNEVVLCTGELSRRPETARMVVTDSRVPGGRDLLTSDNVKRREERGESPGGAGTSQRTEQTPTKVWGDLWEWHCIVSGWVTGLLTLHQHHHTLPGLNS